MSISRSRELALAAVIALAVAACSSSATQVPSPAPSQAPAASAGPSVTPAPSPSPEASPSAVPSPSAAASPVAVPTAELITAGRLTVCSDIPYPPQEFFDANGDPTGSDIDLGAAIAARLGLTETVNNTVFDTIIAALQGNKCDIIISAQNITSDRIKQVDMIPYFQAGQSFVVAKGNPKGVTTTDALCGLTIGAETGTTEVNYLQGTGDYKGAGLTQACTKAGKAPINVKEFEKDSDALLALQGGHVDAYFADSPVAGYYTVQHADQFELAPIPPLQPALEGISVQNDKTHADLVKAVQAALVSMINDGTYATILAKYGVDTSAVTADVAQQLNKTK
jgi:polar amino acid transport system substrate-binding protein